MNHRTLVLLGAVAGCATPVAESVVVQEANPCTTPWVCGSNSPIVDAHGMHDLSLVGAMNASEIHIDAPDGKARIYSSTHQAFDLDVKDGRFIGRDPSGGPTQLNGTALRGAYMLLRYVGKPYYWLTIDRVETRHFTVGPHAGQPYESYVLLWHPIDGAPSPDQNVCSVPLWGHDAKTSPELLSLEPGEVIVFGGDRIDAETKSFTGYDRDWFNLGCAGHALAKLALTGFVSDYDATPGAGAGAQAGFQAALKMFVADYCGTGTPYTVAGHPLVYADALGHVDYFAEPRAYEARWTSQGATCLDRPRLLDVEDTIHDRIRQECALPACDGDGTFHDFGGTDRISGWAEK